MPDKFQSDWTILNKNLMASWLCKILEWDVLLDIETGPWMVMKRYECVFAIYRFPHHWNAPMETIDELDIDSTTFMLDRCLIGLGLWVYAMWDTFI